jgi:hypothetical protein
MQSSKGVKYVEHYPTVLDWNKGTALTALCLF